MRPYLEARGEVLNAFKDNIFLMKNIKFYESDDDCDDNTHERPLTPESPTKVLWEDLLPFGPTQGKGKKILPQKQMLQRLLILLA